MGDECTQHLSKEIKESTKSHLQPGVVDVGGRSSLAIDEDKYEKGQR